MADDKVEDLGARQRLLEVSVKLFAERGLDGTSVRDIAKESGLNLSLVSYYFGGKEGLYLELIQGFARNVSEELERVISLFERESPTAENIKKFLGALVESFSAIRLSHPDMGRILQRERASGLPYASEVYEKTFAPIADALVRQLVKAQKKGLVRKEVNPLLVVIFLQESIIGFHNLMECPLQITQSPLVKTKNFKDFQNQLVNIFINGILT